MNTFRNYTLCAGLAILVLTGNLVRADDGRAFQATASFSVGVGFSEVCGTIATLPAGTRLTIQYAAATVGPVPAGSSVRLAQVKTTLTGGPTVFHNLTQTFINPIEILFGQEVTIYADGIVELCVARLGPTTSALPVIGTVSGRLTLVP